MSFKSPIDGRVTTGPFGTTFAAHGNNGLWLFQSAEPGNPLRVIASDKGGWEHVSVSLHNRCPLWDEMCAVKEAFWDQEDAVMQLHPPRSQWVNNHPYCLHLWRPGAFHPQIPLPPTFMVGIPGLGPLV